MSWSIQLSCKEERCMEYLIGHYTFFWFSSYRPPQLSHSPQKSKLYLLFQWATIWRLQVRAFCYFFACRLLGIGFKICLLVNSKFTSILSLLLAYSVSSLSLSFLLKLFLYATHFTGITLIFRSFCCEQDWSFNFVSLPPVASNLRACTMQIIRLFHRPPVFSFSNFSVPCHFAEL